MHQPSNAQIQFKIGAAMAMGTHLQRIGFTGGIAYPYQNIQINSIHTIYRNFKSYGPNVPSWELQSGIACNIGFGKINELDSNLSLLQLQQNRTTGNIGYAYKYYWSNKGTSQSTGQIAVAYKGFSLFSENDAMAFVPHDKFRTGSLGLAYQKNNWRIAQRLFIWTGAANNTPKQKMLYKGKEIKYSDLQNAKYGKYSHGILATQFHYSIGCFQNLGAELGIDSEHIRDFFQNKLVHNKKISGKLNTTITPTIIPMLDKNGLPYLDGGKQILKANRVVMHILHNDFTD